MIKRRTIIIVSSIAFFILIIACDAASNPSPPIDRPNELVETVVIPTDLDKQLQN